MISKKLEQALNQQIKMEADASFNYLAKASWCEQHKLNGAAQFFYMHSEEERAHMLKIFHYVNEVEGHSITPEVKQPKLKFNSIVDVVKDSLKNEQDVTKSIYKLTELSSQEKDYATYNFLQFYVNEQREEEVLFTHVLDKIALIGLDGKGLYYIDKELGAMATQKNIQPPVAE